MNHSQKRGGYTIIEVMIFLVITGVLLSSALLVFNGRQRRTQFTQGLREIDAQLRTIVNETASGYYPNKGDISCSSSNGGGPQLGTAGTGQGKNVGCTFLGRMIRFTEGESYTAFTVVGQQKGADGKEVTALGPDINEARQTLITNDADTFTLPWGITIGRIALPNGNVTGGVGFVSTFGSYNESGSNLISGSNGISVVTLADTNLESSPETILDKTEAMTNAARTAGPVTLCLRSGGDDRRAAIIIGGNNSNTGTEVVIDKVVAGCEGV